MDRTEILPGVPTRNLDYEVYRQMALDADILLWEPTDAIGRVIARGTSGPFCHASMVKRVAGRVWQGGYHWRTNGDLTPLSREVRDYSGKIHVFRLNDLRPGMRLDTGDREKIADRMVNSLGGYYALSTIGLFVVAYLFGWLRIVPGCRRWFDRSVRAMSRKHASSICSQDVARAYRIGAGVLLCPDHKFEREALISPNDIGRALAKSGTYLGAVLWPSHWQGRRQ